MGFRAKSGSGRMTGDWMDSWMSLRLLRLLELDKAPRPNIRNVIWILSSDTLLVSSTKYFEIVMPQCCLSREPACGAINKNCEQIAK